MAEANILRRTLLRSCATADGVSSLSSVFSKKQIFHTATITTTTSSATAADVVSEGRLASKNHDSRGKWFTLPLFASTVDASSLGRKLVGRGPQANDSSTSATTSSTTTTALKWVLRCCPQLPRSLVQKLFRLRQVRRECFNGGDPKLTQRAQGCRLERVSAKDLMNQGDQIFLPAGVTVRKSHIEKHECHCSEEEMKFIHSHLLYKDPALIAINKPPGLPVQGGHGIKRSLDELAAACLRYDCPEPPRLVHRLDRDSSGILVMGRTQTSTLVLHSIFREKTLGASDDIDVGRRILQKRYLALVFGAPKHLKGLITAPLAKVLVDDGKSERLTVTDSATSSHHAVTEYQVIGTSHGYTWLELSPLTGRKHQLRVHCAEVLGTPIVGDYKYGWKAHRRWKPLPNWVLDDQHFKGKVLDLGLDFECGSISERQPHLHLHCKQMILPSISLALEQSSTNSDFDFSKLETLNLVAPLPLHMQRSWDSLNSLATQASGLVYRL
ncbi:hypothetical protein Ancab_017068 [Ancistrocladus abbreviatus]